MLDFPIKLLIVGYGLSAAIAAAAVGAVGALGAGLIFWIGGALLVLALAATPGVNRFFRRAPASADDEDRALATQLCRWEEDRLADSPPVAIRDGERAAR